MDTTEGPAGRGTTFCLMHSSGQGPQGWKLLVDELQRRGHRALTPAFDVTKTDEGAEFHAETIIEALRESGQRPTDVICVAHSAAGIYLPIVAERWRPRRMIFLAALIPQPGHSIIEQFNADPSMFTPHGSGRTLWTTALPWNSCTMTVLRIGSSGRCQRESFSMRNRLWRNDALSRFGLRYLPLILLASMTGLSLRLGRCGRLANGST